MVWNPSIILAWLVSVLLAIGGGFWYGTSESNEKWEKKAEEAALLASQNSLKLALMVQKRASQVNDALMKQLQRSKQHEKDLQKALGEAGKSVVPGAAVRVLDDATEMPYTPRPSDGAGPRPTPPDSTLARELEICRQNYEDVAIPNAVRAKNLRDFYNEAKEKYNKAIPK